MKPESESKVTFSLQQIRWVNERLVEVEVSLGARACCGLRCGMDGGSNRCLTTGYLGSTGLPKPVVGLENGWYYSKK